MNRCECGSIVMKYNVKTKIAKCKWCNKIIN